MLGGVFRLFGRALGSYGGMKEVSTSIKSLRTVEIKQEILKKYNIFKKYGVNPIERAIQV